MHAAVPQLGLLSSIPQKYAAGTSNASRRPDASTESCPPTVWLQPLPPRSKERPPFYLCKCRPNKQRRRAQKNAFLDSEAQPQELAAALHLLQHMRGKKEVHPTSWHLFLMQFVCLLRASRGPMFITCCLPPQGQTSGGTHDGRRVYLHLSCCVLVALVHHSTHVVTHAPVVLSMDIFGVKICACRWKLV